MTMNLITSINNSGKQTIPPLTNETLSATELESLMASANKMLGMDRLFESAAEEETEPGDRFEPNTEWDLFNKYIC